MKHELADNLIARTPADANWDVVPVKGARGGIGRARSSRRSAVVLIMVVALLAILFVSGAALLTTVTFETKTLNVVRETNENEVMVASIEQSVLELLVREFLGPDGLPYNPESREVIDLAGRTVLPTYGEVPGIHTLIDLTEPQEDGTTAKIVFYSDLNRALNRRTGLALASGMNVPDINRRQVPIVLNQSYADLDVNSYKSDINFDPFDPVMAEPRLMRMQDADGDGVADSIAINLSDSSIPPDIKAAVSERLRDPAVLNVDDPNALWLTIKIVPHGSMVNLNTHIPYCDVLSIPGNEYYPDTLVENALGYNDFIWQNRLTNGEISQSYLPESHEWALRNRGLMLPRNLPQTRMFTELADQLLYPHSTLPQTHTPVSDFFVSANRRWWQYDSASLPNYNNSTWRQMLDPIGIPGAAPYDRTHLVTTINHDDNLIRSASVGGIDMIADLSTNGFFGWGNYPDFLPFGDPRKGRLKFSFPYFSKTQAEGGWLPNGTTLDTLTPAKKTDLAKLIQEAFFLQLRNYAGAIDFDSNGGATVIDPPFGPFAGDNKRISILAAALAANLIDFADNDQTVGAIPDEPTMVEVRDWRTGLVDPAEQDLKVYGLERQPYITEVLIDVPQPIGPLPPRQIDEAASVFAVELYNPYDVPIDLSVFELTDLTDDPGMTTDDIFATKIDTSALRRFVNLPLGGVLAARSYAVFYGYGGSLGTPGAVQLDTDAVFDSSSIIALQRVVGTGPNQVKITVDQVNLTDPRFILDEITDAPIDTAIELPDLVGLLPSTRITTSIQRDTTANAWRFPVPKYRFKPGDVNYHTLGVDNSIRPTTVDPSIRSVHIDFADSGSLRTAFPTTGTMLLLMRHANLDDPSVGANIVPFNHVHDTLMAKQFAMIDNGRMPVFDEATVYHVPPSGNDDVVQGVTALPWGQLVFDYFTALPLRTESTPCNDPNLQDLQGYPPVDMDGLRVSGRINLNTAPWSVLSGLPLMDMDKFKFPDAAGSMKDKIRSAIYPSALPKAKRASDQSDINQPLSDQPGEIGREFAQAIVAYREARAVPSVDPVIAATVDYGPQRGPLTGGMRTERAGYGFLTVGELLNVRHSNTAGSGEWFYNADVGAVANGGDYVSAVARVVALGDWVTTKSHVFTIYGTIRGQFLEDDTNIPSSRASLRTVDQRAIRFQTTIDRLPMLFNPRGKPTRIGSRLIGPYADVRAN